MPEDRGSSERMAVDRDEFLRRIGTVNVWRRGDVRAPHKPLLLLLALGRVVRGETRLVSSEISGQSSAVGQLLDLRGEPLRPPQHPDLAPSTEYVKWHRREVFRGPALSS